MFRYFAENLTFLLVKNKKLDIKKWDIYVYSFEVILLNLVLLLILLGISIIGSCPMFFLGYLIFFVPARTFSGGYHANKSEICLAISLGVYIVSMVFYIYFQEDYNNLTVLIVFILALAILVTLSPLQNENHPLSEYQLNRNRSIVLGIVVADIITFLILSILKCKIILMEVVFIVLVAIFLVIGKVLNNQKVVTNK